MEELDIFQQLLDRSHIYLHNFGPLLQQQRLVGWIYKIFSVWVPLETKKKKNTNGKKKGLPTWKKIVPENIFQYNVWDTYLFILIMCAVAHIFLFLTCVSLYSFLQGFLDLRLQPWIRNFLTRCLAIIPSLIVAIIGGSSGAGKLIIIASVQYPYLQTFFYSQNIMHFL